MVWWLEQAATNNVVGTLSLFDANIISGNTRAGVRISGVGTNGNTVQANRIGTAADSSVAIGTQSEFGSRWVPKTTPLV